MCGKTLRGVLGARRAAGCWCICSHSARARSYSGCRAVWLQAHSMPCPPPAEARRRSWMWRAAWPAGRDRFGVADHALHGLLLGRVRARR